MSVYYSFYVGYTTEDDKVHLFGPMDTFGYAVPILCRSGGFINGTHEQFTKIGPERYGEKLNEQLKLNYKEDDNDNNSWSIPVYICNIDDIRDTNFMRSGYYPTNDIMDYVSDLDDDEGCFGEFYYNERYSIKEYAIKVANALRHDNKELLDELKQFDFFTYPDYESAEYNNFFLVQSTGFSGPFSDYHMESVLKDNGIKYKDFIYIMTVS